MRFIDRGTFQISWVEYIKLNVNIAILRIKSLNTDIVDRLYYNISFTKSVMENPSKCIVYKQ